MKLPTLNLQILRFEITVMEFVSKNAYIMEVCKCIKTSLHSFTNLPLVVLCVTYY